MLIFNCGDSIRFSSRSLHFPFGSVSFFTFLLFSFYYIFRCQPHFDKSFRQTLAKNNEYIYIYDIDRTAQKRPKYHIPLTNATTTKAPYIDFRHSSLLNPNLPPSFNFRSERAIAIEKRRQSRLLTTKKQNFIFSLKLNHR